MKIQNSMLLAALGLGLTACGGGGGASGTADGVPSGSTGGVTALAVAAPTLTSTSLVVGSAVQFGGGTCSGGQGTLTAAWNFGDGSASNSSGLHTFTAVGTYSISVTCSDTAGTPTKTSNTLTVKVSATPVVKNGFLANMWTTQKTIDPTNTAIYPVAALGTDGVVQGLWLKSTSTGGATVVPGQLNTSPLAAAWTINPALDSAGTTTTFLNYVGGTRAAPMDMAISPDGHGMAAWIAGTYLWYSTKTGSSAWTTPIKLNIKPTSDALKVVVSNLGDSAIAYCDAAGAEVVTYGVSSGINATPQQISTTCSSQQGTQAIAVQITHGFDMAMDSATSKIHAVGLMPSTATTGNVLIAERTFQVATGWSAATPISDDLPPSKLAGIQISMSLSPNGQNEAVAWSGTGSGGLSNAFARLTIGGTQGQILPLQANNSVSFSMPYIAINDSGYAFAVMCSDTSPYVVNYQPSKGWMSTPKLVASYSGYGGIDVAIDQYGNGLLTLVDAKIQSLAITLSADGLTTNSQAVFSGYGYGDYHYQTLRTLPDGRAVLVVSTYPSSGYLASSYTILK